MNKIMKQSSSETTFQTNFIQPQFVGNGIPITQSANIHLGLIIGTANHVDPAQNINLFNLCIIDLDNAKMPLATISMPFFGHGVVPDPIHPQRLCVFEKRGKGACEIDLKQGTVTRIIETKSNREFYGHGAYSPDGKLLYCTETITEGEYQGLITIRDAKTHQYLGDFPSFGSSPHDCHLINDGKTMVVTNGGGSIDGSAANVSYIDVSSRTLIKTLEFDNQHVNAGHLDISSEGKIAVVSAQREGLPVKSPGGISLNLEGNVLHTLTEPKQLTERLFDESLSVCIDEKNDVVGATTPTGNLLTFWNLSNGKLLRYYILPNPRGIELSLDKKYFIISYGQGEPAEAISIISTDTLKHVKGSDLMHTGITGSHLTAYSLPVELRQ